MNNDERVPALLDCIEKMKGISMSEGEPFIQFFTGHERRIMINLQKQWKQNSQRKLLKVLSHRSK